MATFNTFRWEPSRNIKFINEYKQHRCLWDPNHPLYKNRGAREDAYTQIKEALDMVNTLEVIGRIRVLRNTLTNELQKARKPRKGQIYKSRIKWLPHMNFIIDVLNGDKKNETRYAPLQIIESDDDTKAVKPVLVDKAVNVPESGVTPNPKPNADEFHLFGETVAEQLRQLPLEIALETEEMVLAVIRKQRIKISNLALPDIELEPEPKPELEPEAEDSVTVKVEDWWESSFDTNVEVSSVRDSLSSLIDQSRSGRTIDYYNKI